MKNIGYIAKSCLADLGAESMENYRRFVKYAIDEYRELRLSGLIEGVNKTVLLDISENNIAYLPDDYVDFIKVGVNCNGVFLNLSYNDKLLGQINTNSADCACPSQQEQQDTLCGCGGNLAMAEGYGWGAWWYSYPTWLDGTFYAGYYGYGGNVYRGGFKIDFAQRIIAFDSWVKSQQVIMEYQSDGMEGDSTLVPESAIPVLIAGVHYRAQKHNPNQRTRLALQPFFNDRMQALKSFRARAAAQTAYDWKQMYLETFSQAPKR
jgi:primosomal replication protein N